MPDEEAWRLTERVARLLEEALAPGATVAHNVRLSELARGRKHRCDVVITYREGPRETRTIVEVRDAKASIRNLRAWWTKRESVGAEHLLCVATKGYSRTAIEEAARLGPRVRLLTLADLRSVLPVRVVWERPLANEVVLDARGPGPAGAVDLADLRFEVGRDPRHLSVDEIVRRVWRERPRDALPPLGGSEAPVEAAFEPPGELGAVHRGRRYSLDRVRIVTRVAFEHHVIPFTFASYEPLDLEGAPAWAGVATKVVGAGEIRLRAIFLPDGDGILRLGSVELTGVPEDAFVRVVLPT